MYFSEILSWQPCKSIMFFIIFTLIFHLGTSSKLFEDRTEVLTTACVRATSIQKADICGLRPAYTPELCCQLCGKDDAWKQHRYTKGRCLYDPLINNEDGETTAEPSEVDETNPSHLPSVDIKNYQQCCFFCGPYPNTYFAHCDKSEDPDCKKGYCRPFTPDQSVGWTMSGVERKKMNMDVGGGVKFDYFMLDLHPRGPTEPDQSERVIEARRDPHRTPYIALVVGLKVSQPGGVFWPNV
ncbi:hypothetical protein GPALN_013152 [Globodera pallida]|nr:hypothetical protein GPALN_013152 [Globodera pallida]